MKNTTRFFLSALSTLLFSLGFAKAGTQADPLAKDAAPTGDHKTARGAVDCVSICSFADEDR